MTGFSKTTSKYSVRPLFSLFSGFPVFMTRVLGLILLVAVVPLFALGCALEGSGSIAVVEVVFSAEVDGNTDVYKTDEETGKPVRLTRAEGRDYSPAWSHDGKKIAFLSDRNGEVSLWVLDVEDSAKRQASETGMTVVGFRWAPDSNRVAVEIVEEGLHRIEISNIESGESDLLTPRYEDARIGDWSPDGQWLVYASVSGDDRGIMRRNPTGVDEIVVTAGVDTDPRWSPNGKWIAFSRTYDDDSIDLMVTDRDGLEVTNLAPDEFDETNFDWSPDSKHIVYESEALDSVEIYVVTPDGESTDRLTSNRVIDKLPRWGGKGSLILFHSEGDDSFDLYTMTIDGDQQVRRTTFAGSIIDADW